MRKSNHLNTESSKDISLSLNMTTSTESQTLQDSKISKEVTTNAEALEKGGSLIESTNLSNSKILSEKCVLQEKLQGSCLSGNDRRDFSQTPNLSPKQSFFRKADCLKGFIKKIKIYNILNISKLQTKNIDYKVILHKL